jgi:hypothetical protein
MLRQECPASLFEREAEVLFGALKTKSCLSEASSFCLAQKSAGVAQKVQTAVFLFCYLFSFCCQKEKSKSKQSQKRYYLCTNKRRKHVSRSNRKIPKTTWP